MNSAVLADTRQGLKCCGNIYVAERLEQIAEETERGWEGRLNTANERNPAGYVFRAHRFAASRETVVPDAPLIGLGRTHAPSTVYRASAGGSTNQVACPAVATTRARTSPARWPCSDAVLGD